MACKYICDACGKESEATVIRGLWHKPDEWLRRYEEAKIFDVCSKECAVTVNNRLGRNAALPSEVPK